MKTTRTKLTLYPTITTREAAEAAVNQYTLTETQLRKIVADRDAEILAATEAYADEITARETDKKRITEALLRWAQANPDAFPKDRKTLEMQAGEIGFRTGTPKLALLSRAWSWEKILGNLRDYMPGFLRKKEEVDKEKIIAERATFPLSNYGLKIVQEETFFVSPKLETPDPKTTTPA